MTIQEIEQRRKNKKQNLEFLKNNDVVIEKEYKRDLVKTINGYKVNVRMSIMEGLYEDLLKEAIEKRNFVDRVRENMEKLSNDFDKINIRLIEKPNEYTEGSYWYISNKDKEDKRSIFDSLYSKIERTIKIKTTLETILEWDLTKVYIDIDNAIYVRPTEEFWNSIENKAETKPYIYKSAFENLIEIKNPVEELLGMNKKDYVFQENIRKLREMKDITIPKNEYPYNKTRWINYKGRRFVHDYFDGFYGSILMEENGAEQMYDLITSRYEKENKTEADIEKTLEELNKTFKYRYGEVKGEYGKYYSFYYKNHLIKRIYAYVDRENLLNKLQELLKEASNDINATVKVKAS